VPTWMVPMAPMYRIAGIGKWPMRPNCVSGEVFRHSMRKDVVAIVISNWALFEGDPKRYECAEGYKDPHREPPH